MRDQSEEAESNSSRRKLMKIAAGVGASSVAIPGLASASEGSKSNTTTSETTDNLSSESSKKMTRAEKAAQEGVDWNPNWVDEDRINETWADINTSTSLETQDSTSGALSPESTMSRSGSGEIGIKGISIRLEWYFGQCEGYIELEAFGQTRRDTLTCSDYCSSISLDGGAAYVDANICYDWDTNTLTADAHGCVWQLSSWSCDDKEFTS